MKKLSAQEFQAISFGDQTLLFRPAKAIRVVDSFGNETSTIAAGGLIIRDNGKVGPGFVKVRLDKATLSDIRTDNAHESAWLAAGVILGERFMSFDKLPKFRAGTAPVVVMRRKRTEDHKATQALWSAWRKWRERGSKETFEHYHFGPPEELPSPRNMSAYSAAYDRNEKRLLAIKAALKTLSDLNLSVARIPS